ncbi:MAG: hypothetical protein ACI81L_001389 [Verrucomicrobiales bacterium]|jgi:hypothetical protein
MKVALLVTLVVSLSSTVASPSLGAQGSTTCAGRRATIVGTDAGEILRGTPKADVIVGNGGADRIFGAGGNDIICGNAGNDYIQGGPGADLIIGGYGHDHVLGGPGNDHIRGGRGDDFLSGKLGADTISGDAGADKIVGNLGIDTCRVQNVDILITGCDRGNFVQVSGTGDFVAKPAIPNEFSVARHCFARSTRCDDYYVARVEMNGSGTFDAMGIQAFDANGGAIATYFGVGDTFEGAFLFKGKPASIEVDSGGGPWTITFVDRAGLPFKRASTNGAGNVVYRVSNQVKNFSTMNATWNGFGNLAVIGVSPSEGRGLMVNEVRFSRLDTPPFAAAATAKSGISVVQVLSTSGTWSVRLGS